jgi:hypothetical protein
MLQLSNRTLGETDLRRFAPSIFATEAHESRSSKFVPIATYDIVKGLAAEGFVPVHARQSRTRDASRRDFTRHMIRFRQQGQTARVVNQTFPEVVLTNANDGSSAYRLEAGLFRLVCLNGLVVADQRFGGARVAHKGDAQTVIGNVIDATYEVIEQAKGALEAPEQWSQIRLNAEVREHMASVAREIRWGEESADNFSNREVLRIRRSEDADPTLWNTYNVLQENTLRGGLHGRNAQTRRRTTSREVQGIDQDLDVNRRLYGLAKAVRDMIAAG